MGEAIPVIYAVGPFTSNEQAIEWGCAYLDTYAVNPPIIVDYQLFSLTPQPRQAFITVATLREREYRKLLAAHEAALDDWCNALDVLNDG